MTCLIGQQGAQVLAVLLAPLRGLAAYTVLPAAG